MDILYKVWIGEAKIHSQISQIVDRRYKSEHQGIEGWMPDAVLKTCFKNWMYQVKKERKKERKKFSPF